jgi:nitrite reductase (NAD(P)H)
MTWKREYFAHSFTLRRTDSFLKRISHVSIINRQAYPLSRQLDADAGEMVLRKIEGMGVQVLTNCSPAQQLTRPATDGSDNKIFTGFMLQDGTTHEADLVIYAIGIKPRDELGQASGIECHPRGGIVVDDNLQTSAPDVYAIGECASWKGNYYGLIAPGSKSYFVHGIETDANLFDSRNGGYPLLQFDRNGFACAEEDEFSGFEYEAEVCCSPPAESLSIEILSRLMGVDVASFGDFFADKRMTVKAQAATAAFDSTPAGKLLDPAQPLVEITVGAPGVTAPAQPPPLVIPKRGGRSADEPIKCLVYNDPFSSTYKKYIFTADGKYLLGGMMIGDVGDFVKLVAIVKKKVRYRCFPQRRGRQ